MNWVFDLDGTLYTPLDHVWDEMVYEMRTYFVDTLHLPVDWSPEEQNRLKSKWQTKQIIIAYLDEFDLDFNALV